MKKLLQLNTSARKNGNANQLADRIVSAYLGTHPETQITVRDLAASPLPHLDEDRISAFFTPEENRTEEQKQINQQSLTLIEEIREADVVVIAAPMYNFGIPSTLKSYFDHVARAGITFRYTANGPEGLLQGKKVIIAAARGGLYAGTANDSQTQYFRTFLGFLGMTDVSFVYAEGLNMGDEAKLRGERQADELIQQALA